MKLKHKALIAFGLLAIAINGHAAGDFFFKGGYKEAGGQADKEGKTLLVFVGKDDCDLCRFTTEAFQRDTVPDFYSRHFLVYKMDPDNAINNMRVSGWGVTSIPSFVFLTPSHKVVYMEQGRKNVQELINMGEAALTKLDSAATRKNNKGRK